jgi:molecular chaperone IbpA
MYNYKNSFDSLADLTKFDKYFVGADKLLARLQEDVKSISNTALNGAYPPFNLKKVDDNKYVIEVAVAGFGKQDIELTLEDNKLLINGKTTLDTLKEDGTEVSFLHKGISDRAFSRTFTLADNVVVQNAKMVNGLLKIWLEHIIPEDKKPKKIDIEEETVPAQNLKKVEASDKYIPE